MHSVRYYRGAVRYSRRLQYRAVRFVLGVALAAGVGLVIADLLVSAT